MTLLLMRTVSSIVLFLLTLVVASALKAQPISFDVGGVSLEPQDLPEFLHPYHKKSIELSEAAFSDPSLTCSRAVPYGNLEHQLLDVWTRTPAITEEGGKLPIVIFLHGGGWDWGYREWVGFCARQICHNAIMFAPSYTIGKGKNTAWPQSRDDIRTAVQWAIDNGQKHGGDPKKIILAGHSAGGHLAACVGLDPSLLENNSAVRGLFLISCPLGIRVEDFFLPLAKRRWLWKIVGPLARQAYRKGFFKALRPVVGEEGKISATEDASPLYQLTRLDDESSPELPFVHYSYAKEKDFPICRPQAKALGDILELQVLEMPVSGHFESHFFLDDASCEWHEALKKFISSL